jgi:hypothetical protein
MELSIKKYPLTSKDLHFTIEDFVISNSDRVLIIAGFDFCG